MEENYLVNFLEAHNAPVIKKKKHMYLAYHGLEESYTYVLKEGVVKTSIILKDGREFNLAYITPIDIISLLRDEVSNYTSAPFNVRVESDEASFYRIQRIKFWEYVKEDRKLQDYIREYYRQKLSENRPSCCTGRCPDDLSEQCRHHYGWQSGNGCHCRRQHLLTATHDAPDGRTFGRGGRHHTDCGTIWPRSARCLW